MSAPPPPSVTASGEVVGSDFGRHDEHPGASMSVAWMPIGRACQQPAFTVSDVRRSQRTTRNTSIKSSHVTLRILYRSSSQAALHVCLCAARIAVGEPGHQLTDFGQRQRHELFLQDLRPLTTRPRVYGLLRSMPL
jgi:hypothetical protein